MQIHILKSIEWFYIFLNTIGLSTSSETSGDVTTQLNSDETGEIDDEEEELDINGICEILQKMLEKAGITKSCEEIFKMMAESDRYA